MQLSAAKRAWITRRNNTKNGISPKKVTKNTSLKFKSIVTGNILEKKFHELTIDFPCKIFVNKDTKAFYITPHEITLSKEIKKTEVEKVVKSSNSIKIDLENVIFTKFIAQEFKKMKVSEIKELPCKNRKSFANAILSYSKATGTKFTTKVSRDGYRAVLRLK